MPMLDGMVSEFIGSAVDHSFLDAPPANQIENP